MLQINSNNRIIIVCEKSVLIFSSTTPLTYSFKYFVNYFLVRDKATRYCDYAKYVSVLLSSLNTPYVRKIWYLSKNCRCVIG